MMKSTVALIEKETRKLFFLAFEEDVLLDTTPAQKEWVRVSLKPGENGSWSIEQPIFDGKGHCNYKLSSNGETILRSGEEKMKDTAIDDVMMERPNPSELAIVELTTIAAQQALAIAELSEIIGGEKNEFN